MLHIHRRLTANFGFVLCCNNLLSANASVSALVKLQRNGDQGDGCPQRAVFSLADISKS